MLDVGANIGVIGIGLALAHQVNMAVAIEPEPRNFARLRKNVAQNGLSQRILAIQLAVGDKASTLNMELSGNNLGDHRIHQAPASDAAERFHESASDHSSGRIAAAASSGTSSSPRLRPFFAVFAVDRRAGI